MYNLEYTNKFKREYKLCLKRGYKEVSIQRVITSIANKTPLAPKHKAHKLSGDYQDCWECHIQPDWLLIRQIDEVANTLILISTGTHADLF